MGEQMTKRHADGQAVLFEEGAVRSRPPVRRRALESGDARALAIDQVAEAEVLLEAIVQQRPQHMWVPGKHRCEQFPNCGHAGCEALKNVQDLASKMLERWRAERRSPARALRDIAESQAALDHALDELERARNSNRRAS